MEETISMVLRILSILFFTFWSVFGQSEKEYKLNLNNIQYEYQRTGSEQGFTDIYTVKDKTGKPKYLIYVIMSLLDNDGFGYIIDDFYEDEDFILGLYDQLKCFPKSKAKKSQRGNTLGYESQIDFKNEGNGIKMPGLMYSALQKNKLYHILFMLPNYEMKINYESELNEVLNSLEL